MFSVTNLLSRTRRTAPAGRVSHTVKARTGSALFAATLLAVTLPALAVQAVQPGQQQQSRLTQPVVAAQLHVQPDLSATLSLVPAADSHPGVASFINNIGGQWEVRWDRRSMRPNVIQGSGVAVIPGNGNALDNGDVGLAPAQAMTLDTVAASLRTFWQSRQKLLGTTGLSFQLDRAASGVSGNDRNHWTVRFGQYYKGVPVHDAYLYFRLSHGNIVQFGAQRVAPVELKVKPALDRKHAFAAAFRQMPLQPDSHISKVFEAGQLLILPTLAHKQPLGTRYTGVPGQGYSHLLAWRFVFQLEDDYNTYEVFLDAHSNQLLEVRSLTDFTQATVTGGIYVEDGRTTEVVVPLPFASVSNNGQKVTDIDGQYDYSGGTASTSLNGRYFMISDDCGSILLSDNSDGNLDLGSSGGTDCTTPGVGGGGNTHASRTGFYHLTMINRMAHTYLPNNSWLDSTVLVNVNINNQCNAFWNGYSLNFYQSGGGCANTGEIPGVFLHEWGHGIDSNTGGSAPDHGSGEAVGDTFAMIYLQNGCIGNGFRPNQSGECTGVRWPKAFSVHDQQPGYPVAKPSNIEQFAGGSCPYYTPSGVPYQGVMGYEGHRESLIISSANWDLAQNLIGEYGNQQGWEELASMWYGSLQASKSAYQIVSGGRCEPTAEIDGCAAGNWYTALLAADDDDGNLANGTPNACRIWDAYEAHGIACGTRPTCTGGAGADFTIGSDTSRQAICVPDDAAYSINIGARAGFANPVTLSVDTLPSGVSAAFSANPVTPGTSSQLTLSAAAGTAAGNYSITINGSASDSQGHATVVQFVVTDAPPGTPVLQAPADGAINVPASITLSWQPVAGSESYAIEIATDAAFTDIVASQSGITGSTYQASGLVLNTTYYWRVTAANACGIGVASDSASFTTVLPESRHILGSLTGLQGDSVTVQLNGSETLKLTGNGAFFFSTGVLDGQTYDITVSQQPSNPQQTCTVENGSGTMQGHNISDVKVTCGAYVQGFSVGGSVTNLLGSGLVLQLNGGHDLAVSGANFTFPAELADGSSYEVTVLTQPSAPQQLCTVSSGSGSINGSDVTDVAVSCNDDRIFADGFEGSATSAHR